MEVHQSWKRSSLTGMVPQAHLMLAAMFLSSWYRLARRKTDFIDLIKRVQGQHAADRSVASGYRVPRPSPTQISRAVRLGTSLWPFRTTCLIRSLVLARLLRHFRYSASMVLGISEEEAILPDSRFSHAWVEVQNHQGQPGFGELVRIQVWDA